MKFHWRIRRRFLWLLASAGSLSTIATIPVGLTFAATSGGVTNIFKPLSTPAQAIHEVSLLVLAICAGIFLVVAGLLPTLCCGFANGLGMKGMSRRKSTAAISSNSPGQ